MGILLANAVVLTLLLSFTFEKKELAVLHWKKQDGRLAPAYFLQEYKFFDRLLLTVKNETTVRNLVNESFLQTSIPPLLSTFYAKKGKPRHFVQIFCLTVPKSYVGEHFVVSQNFRVSKILCIKRGYHWTPLKIFRLTVPILFVEEPFCVSKGFWYRNFSSKRGGKLHNFVKTFFLTGPKKTSPGKHSLF